MKISRVQEMRDADARAIANYGIPQEILMENAGLAAFYAIQQATPITKKHFVIFCGAGNNGGDGLVVARKLQSNGAKVSIFILGNPENFKGAALCNFQIVQKLNIKIKLLTTLKVVHNELAHCDAIVDAIFGTGLARAVEAIHAEIIQAINAAGKVVFSLDIASGINGDNGQIMKHAVQADQTITFGLPKLGNLLFPGYEKGGKLFVTHISFPAAIHNDPNLKVEVNIPQILPARSGDAHKGSVGKTLFVAGSANYLGAPYFAAQAYLKAGGGLSYLATAQQVAPYVATSGREIVFLPLAASAEGSIAYSNRDELIKAAENTDMTVIGPGLSLNKETSRLALEIISSVTKPILIDGDALTAVSENPEILRGRNAQTVLTPHLGEMSRLSGYSLAEIEQNKIDILQETSRNLNAIIVLKGAHSLIGMRDDRIFLNLSGNPGMATAGSGDVLTGTISAMFGLGLDFENAIRTGVFMHGFAGDLAAKQIGQDGLLASDILNFLPPALKKYREDFNRIFKNNYNKIFLL